MRGLGVRPRDGGSYPSLTQLSAVSPKGNHSVSSSVKQGEQLLSSTTAEDESG